MAHFHLAPFDRDRDFVVQRDRILWKGEWMIRGAEFPKGSATTRSLRLLYETRAICYREDIEKRLDAVDVAPKIGKSKSDEGGEKSPPSPPPPPPPDARSWRQRMTARRSRKPTPRPIAGDPPR